VICHDSRSKKPDERGGGVNSANQNQIQVDPKLNKRGEGVAPAKGLSGRDPAKLCLDRLRSVNREDK
jgi:hypothetical protein